MLYAVLLARLLPPHRPRGGCCNSVTYHNSTYLVATEDDSMFDGLQILVTDSPLMHEDWGLSNDED
jgi:hypothetical protein